MSNKGKGKIKMKDLRSYWSSGSSSNPSGVTNIAVDVEEQVTEETENAMAAETVEDHTENTMTAETIEDHTENAMETGEVEVGADTQPEGIITQFSLDHIVIDPGLRIPIDRFAANIRSDVRRAFIAKGPTQPIGHNFPKLKGDRCFQETWFKNYPWLEYSVEKDKAYCFYCYLFKHDNLDDKFGYDAFTKLGFSTWKNAYKALPKHVGQSQSIHNQCRTAYEDFDNQRSSMKHKVTVHKKDAASKYETRLDTSLGIVSLLSLQGEPFRGHDESSTSLNKGNFLEILDWYKARNEEVKLAFDELCPKNAQMTSPTIQKELSQCCGQEITKAIKEEMRGCLFSVLIDESRDISIKEQMAVIVRFMNQQGKVVERFLGIKHVTETTSEALKKALVEVLGGHGLVLANLRGQGYQHASSCNNILRHQLQLVVVAVSRCCSSLEDFFEYVTLIVNTTSASCKRKDLLLDKYRRNMLAKLDRGEISSGRGKNQATSLASSLQDFTSY